MPAYYDRKGHCFWLQTGASWVSLDRSSLAKILIEHGKSNAEGTSIKGARNATSQVDEEINRVIREQQLDVVCDVAGWPIGVHSMYGKQVLVTRSPQLLTLKAGDFPFHEKFLRAIARDHPIQYDVLKSWMHLGYDKIYNFNFRYSQILIMVGEHACGKSLFHLMITTHVGGRVSDGKEFAIAGNQFNKDTAESLHVKMEEPSVHSLKDRQTWANHLKTLAVEEAKRCRGLYNEAISVCPYQLVSCSTNTEYDNIHVVPNLDTGIEDKLIVPYFPSNTMPLAGYEGLQMREIKAIVEREAPAFVHHLLHEYKVPEDLRKRVDHAPFDCQRFGMDAYHNPVVVQTLEERSSELQLLAALERVATANGSSPITGTAAKLAEWLRNTTNDPDAVQIAKDTRRVGHMLGRLSKKFPSKVQKLQDRDKQGYVWMICPTATDGN
jgi:hypothetical protein